MGAGAESRRGWGDLGQEILAVLERADTAMTPAQVRDALGGQMAYTTVMTVLTRLHGRGILSRERSGRAYAYTVTGEPARITARRMHRLLAVENDRAEALAHFVGGLSGEDEAVLRTLLEELGGPGGHGAGTTGEPVP